jgi:hypothetical protein
MAKAKKIKKALKKVVQHVKSAVKEKSHSNIRKTIESLASERRDAAVIWEQIKDSNHSDEEIKAIINSKNFFVLLGNIS